MSAASGSEIEFHEPQVCSSQSSTSRQAAWNASRGYDAGRRSVHATSACASRSAAARPSAVSRAEEAAPSSQNAVMSPRTTGNVSPASCSSAAKAVLTVEITRRGVTWRAFQSRTTSGMASCGGPLSEPTL